MMNEIIENSKWGLGDFAQILLIYFFTLIAFYFLYDLLLRSWWSSTERAQLLIFTISFQFIFTISFQFNFQFKLFNVYYYLFLP